MSRPATGTVVEPKGTRKSWAIRFPVAGMPRQNITLGRTEDGWNRLKAEEALKDVLAEVRLGTWQPPRNVAEPSPAADQTFHEFAEIWVEDREAEWRPSTKRHIYWCLEKHLLGAFGEKRLSEITVEDVDRFAREKQRGGKLSNNSINKLLVTLCSILDVAVDWGRIDKNPAAGKKRRLRPEPKRRLHVEPEQLMTLLRCCHVSLRPLVATMAGAGLRISEAINLTWADVNFGANTIRVRESKTAAGVRVVDMPVGLSWELRTLRSRTKYGKPSDFVFRSRRTGQPQTDRNAQRRLKVAIREANRDLSKLGIDPISEGVSPHSLRRTYASMRFACNDDVIYVAEQGGWEDPSLPMKIYAKSVKRRQKLNGAHLEAFDEAIEWAQIGTKAEDGAEPAPVIQLPKRASAV